MREEWRGEKTGCMDQRQMSWTWVQLSVGKTTPAPASALLFTTGDYITFCAGASGLSVCAVSVADAGSRVQLLHSMQKDSVLLHHPLSYPLSIKEDIYGKVSWGQIHHRQHENRNWGEVMHNSEGRRITANDPLFSSHFCCRRWKPDIIAEARGDAGRSSVGIFLSLSPECGLKAFLLVHSGSDIHECYRVKKGRPFLLDQISTWVAPELHHKHQVWGCGIMLLLMYS